MSKKALSGTGEAVAAADTYVSSALAYGVQCYLPAVNDGSGSSVAVDNVKRFETTGGGKIEILTADGVCVSASYRGGLRLW